MKKPPKILDKIADVVLGYRPPARTKKAKKRQRKRRKLKKPRGTAAEHIANWNERVPRHVRDALEKAVEAFED